MVEARGCDPRISGFKSRQSPHVGLWGQLKENNDSIDRRANRRGRSRNRINCLFHLSIKRHVAMTNPRLQAFYEYYETHCIVCHAEVPRIQAGEDSYVYTRFCDKPECKKQQQEYYDSWW